jgi:cell division septation protein DedD
VVVKLPVTGNRLVEKNIGRYTIQVAAYKDRKNAQREAEVLRKSGLEVKLLVKGNYSVLYAGNFANREKAQMAMGKLEKKYKGCIIRRL